jgi:hypothetical protein
MGIAYVTEFAEMAIGPAGRVGQIVQQPPVASQVVSFTGTAGTSAAFNAKTRIVRVNVDSISSILFSTAGTAAVANTDARMAAGQTEYFGVPQGQAFKISIVVTSV